MTAQRLTFLLIAGLLVLLTIVDERIGGWIQPRFDSSSSKSQAMGKVERTIELLDQFYMDSIAWETAGEGAVNGLLNTLDPHSVYINAEEARRNSEEFEGRYFGIGIQFDILNHYPFVISVFPDSPAEKAGLLAGDQIIGIDGTTTKDISTEDVPRRLKGEKNSRVTVTVSRKSIPDSISCEIIRSEIPLQSVTTFFMLDSLTGYIWLSRFSETSSDEVETAMIKLEKKGMQRLVLDLRNNAGGLLQEAVEVCSKFLDGRQPVVSTKGRMKQFNKEYFADTFGKSLVRTYPLVILINEFSASASEIVAGAIQDHDRGVIAGERSFGKGLVQNEFSYPDESRLRLTISKYFTPSGRLIQRDYQGIDRAAYYQHQGAGKNTAIVQVYKTRNGREIASGGGIEPDFMVESGSFYSDTAAAGRLLAQGAFFSAALELLSSGDVDTNSVDNLIRNSFSDRLIIGLLAGIDQRTLSDSINLTNSVSAEYVTRVKAEIARQVWGNEAYWQVLLSRDKQLSEYQKIFAKYNEILYLGSVASGQN